MFISDFKKEFLEPLAGERLLIFAHNDVDSLCSLKILQKILQADHISYSVVAVGGKTELLSAFGAVQGDCSLRFALLLNCGGNIDVSDFLENERVVFFLADAHRPLHVCNIYNETQVRILSVPENGIPAYDDIFKDEENEEDDEDDEIENDERRKTNSDPNYRSFLIWEKRRRKILFDYEEYSYYGPPTALSFYNYAWRSSREDEESLWSAIVSVTESFLSSKSSVSDYGESLLELKAQVRRFYDGNSHNNTYNYKISGEKELFLNVYRHWSLYDAFLHSSLSADKLKLWNIRGKERKLHEFFADCGLPLSQIHQKYLGMDYSLKHSLLGILENKVEKYSLDSLFYESFVLRYRGIGKTFSASDFALSLAASLETEPFVKALSILSKTDSHRLEEGIHECQEHYRTLYSKVSMLLESKLIGNAGPFLYTNLSEGFFKTPDALRVLGSTTLRAYLSSYSSSSSKKKNLLRLPLVLLSPSGNNDGNVIVVGVPSNSDPLHQNDDEGKNNLGKFFESAAKRSESRYLLDYFDSSVFLLKSEDVSKFLDALISIMA